MHGIQYFASVIRSWAVKQDGLAIHPAPRLRQGDRSTGAVFFRVECFDVVAVGAKNSAELQTVFCIGFAVTQVLPFQPLEFT
jgi:hypothetical protein